MHAGASIVVDEVTFAYRRSQAQVIKGISMTVGACESVCLWGPSGSGKSTLLSLIGGVLSPRAGTVDIFVGDGRREVSQSVSWVLQTANLLPSVTALENVMLGLLIAGVDREKSAIIAQRSMEDLDIGDLSMHKAKRLSGGQAQRVAVARALAVEAPLILADEPSGQLDRRSTVRVCDALLDQTTGRATVVVASHDPYVAERCDRVITLEDGRIRS